MLNNMYDHDYYEKGVESGKSLYSNFRWMPELTIPMCAEIMFKLEITENQSILDFGCAKGYVVKAFRLLHRQAYGVDISKYAIQCAPRDVENYIKLIDDTDKIPLIHKNKKYDWVIAKDVFEHIDYNSIDCVLKNIREACDNILVVVPLGDGKTYNVPSYELDKTHIIREDLSWWHNKLSTSGFNVSHSSYEFGHIKENWSTFKESNGFFVCEQHCGVKI